MSKMYPKEPFQSISLKNLKFLSGTWRLIIEEEGKTQTCEEIWSGVDKLSGLMGVFRLFRGGIIIVYEILQIIKDDDQIKMRLRHFDCNFNSWEEKNQPLEFVLVKFEPQRVVFYRIDKLESGWFEYLRRDDNLRFRDYDTNGTIGMDLNFQKSD